MMTRWTVSIVVGAVALVLSGAGMATAKDHGSGPNGHGKGHGHGLRGGPPDGKPHGRPDGGHGSHGAGKGGGSCDAASSTMGAFVDATCPCAGPSDGSGGSIAWRNHGQYVRCVAHAVRDAARAAGAKRRCGKALVRCAARSSCGKDGAVACLVPAGGTCVDGACSDDPAVACLTDAECAASACSVLSGDECTALGGVGGPGSCCSASPSGAFVD
jgi:hypothetical protein